jgi:hypothetical protein
MASNHMIRFRVSKEQMQMIQFDAISNGFLTPSAYMRDLAIKKHENFTEKRLNEILTEIKQLKEERK